MPKVFCVRLFARIVATATVATLLSPPYAFSQTVKPTISGDTARLAYAAFECSAFAEIAEEPKREVSRLLQLGYENGKRFLEAFARGEVSVEDMQTKVPVVWLGVAAGPNIDFRLGHAYALASQFAYDRVIKHDKNGIDMPIESWRLDPQLKKAFGASEYRTRNCGLLK